MPQATAKNQQPAPPAPPAGTPSAPLLPQGTTFGSWAVPIKVPLTQQDVNALMDRRSELSTQLSSATGRRNDLSRQLRNARAGPDQTGIETRISQLDARIGSIEAEMADVGHALSAAPSGLYQVTTVGTSVPPRYGQPTSNQVTAIAIVGTIFVLAPIAIGMTIRMLRRPFVSPAPQIPRDVSDRLERMEQGIEAISIEVERIGEGQRFVTQLMSDRASRAALPEGVPKI
jgi:hypothetical protein